MEKSQVRTERLTYLLVNQTVSFYLSSQTSHPPMRDFPQLPLPHPFSSHDSPGL